MATTFASLGLDHLSDDEKWQVFRDLEDELEALSAIPGGFATRAELHADLRRRAAEDDANPGQARDFFEVHNEIMRELDGAGLSK